MFRRRLALVALPAIAALTLTGCGSSAAPVIVSTPASMPAGGGGGTSTAPSAPDSSPASGGGEATTSGAAPGASDLQGTLDTIRAAFDADHTYTSVFTTGGSTGTSTLSGSADLKVAKKGGKLSLSMDPRKSGAALYVIRIGDEGWASRDKERWVAMTKDDMLHDESIMAGGRAPEEWFALLDSAITELKPKGDHVEAVLDESALSRLGGTSTGVPPELTYELWMDKQGRLTRSKFVVATDAFSITQDYTLTWDAPVAIEAPKA